MIKDNDLDLDFIMNRRFKLLDRTLEEVADKVQNQYGVEVLEILETDEGYVFKGKYGYTIGDLTFDEKNGRYKAFNYHRGVVESINERDKKVTARRKYKVQRNKRIGVAFTATALIALAGIGVIKGMDYKNNHNDLNSESIEVSFAERTPINTVNNANDLLLVAWSNYAMGEVSDFCCDTEIDALQGLEKDVYTNVFAPVMMDYYNYLDYIDSPLPEDIIGESLKNSHSQFRNSVLLFDEHLKDLNFISYTFASSPFAYAIILDQDGNKVEKNGQLDGEVVTKDGALITFDGEQSYSVYIRGIDVPNNDYSITNMPSDAKLIDGEIYVDYIHLFQNEKTGIKSK